MTYTMPKLRELLDGEDLRYYLIPDRDGVMLTLRGDNGRFQFVVLLEEDGEFLQFRSTEFLYCPLDHPHLEDLLRIIGELNYRMRLVKFGWDPTDGEIVAYVDQWIMDAEITQQQFSRMMSAYMNIVDDEFPKLQAAIESGAPRSGLDGWSPSGESGDDDTVDSL